MTEDILKQKLSQTQTSSALQENTLPKRSDERWKYTDLSRILNDVSFKGVISSTEKLEIDSEMQLKLSEHPNRLVLVDGFLELGLSQFDADIIVDESEVDLLTKIDAHLHSMARINTKSNTRVISVSINATLKEPLTLLHILSERSQQRWVQPLLEVSLRENATAEVHEKVLSLCKDSIVFNALTSIKLHQASSLVYMNNLAFEPSNVFNIHGLHIYQSKDSQFEYNHVALESKLFREDIHVHLNEVGSSCNLMAAGLITDKSHVDYHIIVEHHASNTISNVDVVAIAANKAVFVCNPKAIVDANIKGISAHQRSNNLLFDTTAAINTKPELEIYSDDVQCTHGATIGQLDEQALFYMQSRGVSESKAKELLTEAFLGAVIDNFSCDKQDVLKASLIKKVENYYK
ncbi:SufD family Fe-S cluster assembly protein [Thiotrichales bacterium 19S3-7]|nr:SufD family Fe-S cluster assembly protein [Thiotrichales bacterium 19S3-7]MCF6801417.1 SufD family Fe-S cluster assembly protein [Thiotrichales bacterium 19S3-11]